jgi:rod shape-determining protein MreC
VLVIVGFGLLMVGRTEPEVFDGLKQRVLTTLAPVLKATSGPVSTVRNWRRSADDMLSVYEDNKRLRDENQELRVQAERARHLQSLIERYQALLNVKVDPAIDYLTARVIGDSGGPFGRSLIINAGGNDGVKAGQGIVDASGLLGHVVSAGPHAARALLLTDVESHIPVVIEDGSLRALLTGDGKDHAMLEHLPPSQGVVIKTGSRVVTSGVAGILPPGILVGVVGKFEEGASAIPVTLASNFDRLDVVRVLRYDMPLQAEPTGGLTAPLIPNAAPAPVAQQAPAARPIAAALPAAPAAAKPKPATPPRPVAQAPAGGTDHAVQDATAANDAQPGAARPNGL